jgi:transposase
VAVTISPTEDAELDRRLRRASSYTLIRNRVPGWQFTDEQMVAAYTDQWRVEHGFAWLKSQAAINPMFLESDHRIESLCLIYHIALMVQTLVQRNVRRGLRRRGWKLPYHRNKPSDKITARFTFELFRNVTSLVISNGTESDKRIFGDNEHTHNALMAMGVGTSAYTPILHEREIREK